MKHKYFQVLAAGAIALGSVLLTQKPSMAQSARGFFCGNNQFGVPTTYYRSTQGNLEPWINWESNFFGASGYDPLTRCQMVSSRLENYRANRQLRYITVGIMNGERVICTASQINGRCEGLIYTLKPNQDAVYTLYNFLAWREGQAGVPSMSESGEIPYIDVSDRIEQGNTPTAVPTTPMQNPQVSPQTPPTSPGMREL